LYVLLATSIGTVRVPTATRTGPPATATAFWQVSSIILPAEAARRGRKLEVDVTIDPLRALDLWLTPRVPWIARQRASTRSGFTTFLQFPVPLYCYNDRHLGTAIAIASRRESPLPPQHGSVLLRGRQLARPVRSAQLMRPVPGRQLVALLALGRPQ
jgi:hypothetical protein